jgi:hypothetical protein
VSENILFFRSIVFVAALSTRQYSSSASMERTTLALLNIVLI